VVIIYYSALKCEDALNPIAIIKNDTFLQNFEAHIMPVSVVMSGY
jgi:hypothetical protein